ncbi:hypothetical protein NDI89_13930 [Natrinema sp. S1CR25-10]|uniref:Fenitrothion hydrolase n=1 Tax=Natrinema salsiterrestre TaxID=2950540 RepID=A0A9Q4Q0L1_9EURY|nr:hypothetical protein [Natrinema salsiterrestre]
MRYGGETRVERYFGREWRTRPEISVYKGMALFGTVLAVLPGTVTAHGSGARYELGIPQSLFLLAGGAAVVISFVAVSVLSGGSDEAFSYRSRRLSTTPLRVFQSSSVVGAARFVAVGLLVVSVLAGFFGPQSSDANLLTNLVWVGWWIGYTFSVVLVGNTWPTINPWKTCYERATSPFGRELSLERSYEWGHRPAVASFLGFAWLEVIAPFSASPRWMAGIVLAYSVYLWAGMFVFGTETWLRNADPFTLLFDYLGRFAPLSFGPDAEVRMYGVALVDGDEGLWKPGALAFFVAILYTVTFDGFLGTPDWAVIANGVPALPIPYLTSTLLMLVGFVLFVEVFGTVAWLMKRFVGDVTPDEGYLARRFALSLLPIAIAYQLSHFFPHLLLRAQYLVLALLDPLGLGWNPLGLAEFEPVHEIPLLPVQAVWLTQTTLVVAGHVVAVWVAHHVAMDVFEERRSAIRSQLPMTAVMVFYTIVGLLILTRAAVDPPLP